MDETITVLRTRQRKLGATDRRKLPSPPSKDKRWKLIDVTMRRNGYADHALIETLHTVQDCFGYLDQESLRYVAQSLRLPPSKVFWCRHFLSSVYVKAAG